MSSERKIFIPCGARKTSAYDEFDRYMTSAELLTCSSANEGIPQPSRKERLRGPDLERRQHQKGTVSSEPWTSNPPPTITITTNPIWII